MQTLLIATTNKGKIHELGLLLKSLPVKLVSLSDVNINQDVDEDGASYEENSQKKARVYATLSGLPAISDDGGLEIGALGGMPGIKSRRWLGHEGTDEELMNHMRKIAHELPNDNRSAKFVTVVTLAMPNGDVWSERGEVAGEISKEPTKIVVKGYPYRSFFYLPQLKKFYHETELTTDEMKEYNHRYKAIEKLKPIIIQKLHL